MNSKICGKNLPQGSRHVYVRLLFLCRKYQCNVPKLFEEGQLVHKVEQCVHGRNE